MDRNDRALTAFAMLGHATYHTFELVVPIFVVVWLDVFPVSQAVLGLVVGASYALVGVGAVPSGLLADRFTSRGLILVCLAGMGASFGLVALAPSVPVLAVALLGWGAFASIYHPAGLALVSRGATERGTALAYHGVAGNVGVATGPLLATVLLSFLGWRAVAVALLVPVVAAIVIGLRLEFDETAGAAARRNGGSEPTGEETNPGRAFLSQTVRVLSVGFGVVLVVGVLYGLYYRGATTFLPEVLGDMPVFAPTTVAGREIQPSQYVYSALLLLGGLGQYAGGKLVDRIAVERVLLGANLALVAVALAFVPAGLAGVVPTLAVAAAFGFFVFLIAPVNQEAISAYSPASVRGLSYGFSYTAVFGVGALGSTLAGVVLWRSTAAVLFVVLAGIAGLGVLLAGVLVTRSLRPADATDGDT